MHAPSPAQYLRRHAWARTSVDLLIEHCHQHKHRWDRPPVGSQLSCMPRVPPVGGRGVRARQASCQLAWHAGHSAR